MTSEPAAGETLRALDRRHIWHPFTQMAGWQTEDAPVIVAGEGCELIDADGRRYLDGISSLWCNVWGHRHPVLDAALLQQLGRIAHSTMLGLSHEPSIRLAEQLVALAPAGLSRVFYSDNGSTAVEIALKMAFQYWQQAGRPQKTDFVAFENAYHGDTIGSVSLGGIDLFHQLYKPLLFGTRRAQYPYGPRWPRARRQRVTKADTASLEQLLSAHHKSVAAVVIEPLVQGAGGMITAPEGFLHKVRELCNRYDCLLIADEVATGFGRTGTLFACDQEAVSPDLLCLAKGITAGYLPLAATLATERVYEGFLGDHDSQTTFFHGHTYTGNPLACAVALANLSLFSDPKCTPRIRALVAQIETRVPQLLDHPHVGDVRQRGLMLGVELVASADKRYPLRVRMGHRVTLAARRRGVILRPLGDTLVLMPPLSISDAELQQLFDVALEAISAATATGH